MKSEKAHEFAKKSFRIWRKSPGIWKKEVKKGEQMKKEKGNEIKKIDKNQLNTRII